MTGAFQGLLALMNRALQTEDRLLRTHLYRFGFVVLTYAMLIGAQRMAMFFGAPGLTLFRSICILNFFAINVAGLSFFAAAITEEKEDMTLGLLKMAGVSPLALLLGKSMPRLVAALVLLTAQLPFTMLAITLGGVSLYQVLAAYCCLFAYLVFVANLALFFSVVCPRTRTAGLFTGIVLFIYAYGPSFWRFARDGLIFKEWWVEDSRLDGWAMQVQTLVQDTFAYNRIQSILTTGFSESAISLQVVVNLALGVALLLLGWLTFEPSTRNEVPVTESRGLLMKRLGTGRGFFGSGRAWERALEWKDFHFVGGGKIMLMLKVGLYFGVLGLIVWVAYEYGNGMKLSEFGGVAMSLGCSAIVIESAILASRVFYTEVKWKTLSSIILLPKSVSRVAYSKIAGAAISLIPACLVLIIGILCATKDFTRGLGDMLDEPGAWYMLSQIVFLIHLAALLSLYVKWGALPLAFAGTYAGNLLVIFAANLFFRFTNPGDTFFAFMTLLSYASCAAIHVVVGRKLKQLAAS